jgi:hypothetical protein
MADVATDRFGDRSTLAAGCPTCGAAAGRRCREVTGEWMAEKYGRPRRYRHVRPHLERVALARSLTRSTPE